MVVCLVTYASALHKPVCAIGAVDTHLTMGDEHSIVSVYVSSTQDSMLRKILRSHADNIVKPREPTVTARCCNCSFQSRLPLTSSHHDSIVGARYLEILLLF